MTDFTRLTQKDAAKVFGKTAKTIQNWSDAGAPRNADGTYSAPALVEWLIERSEDGNTSLDLSRERARLAKMQADKTEQEVELRAGRMLDAEAVAEWVSGMLSATTARLVQVPDAVAQLVDQQYATPVAESVRRAVYEALEDLSSNAKRIPGRNVGAPETAPEADG